MHCAHRTPSRPALSHYVDLLWLSEGYVQPHASERLLPTGCMDLVLSLDEQSRIDSVSGAQSRCAFLDTSRPLRVIGVRFTPGGGFPFFGVPAAELQNQRVPLDCLWGPEAGVLRERLLEAHSAAARFDILEHVLLQRLQTGPARSPAVSFAIAMFQRPSRVPSVAAVVERIGYSQRHLIASFRNEVGLTPKMFSRIARWRRAIDSLRGPRPVNWSALAVDCGYFDQAHFIHEFRELAGITPAAYVRHRVSCNHVAA
jgi:AraC-like DNA-binding protein